MNEINTDSKVLIITNFMLALETKMSFGRMYRHKEKFIFVEFLNVLLNNIEEYASWQNPITDSSL